MDEEKTELSPRYYIAEAAVWILGGILVVARVAGLSQSQSIPFLDVTPEKQQYVPRILAVLLLASTMYLLVEWRQSTRQARASHWAQLRSVTTTIWACVALWLSYSLVFAGTRFADVSPVWYATFLLIGTLIGTLAAAGMFTALMIRTPGESKRLCLPRVPAATRAQFVAWVPGITILITAYYLLWHFAPESIRGIAPFLVAAPVFVMLGGEFKSFWLTHDEEGKRVPYRARIAQLRKAFDFHDYAYFLIDHRDVVAKELPLGDGSPPQAVQEAMQRKFAQTPDSGPTQFHVQQLEEMQLQFYPKDGNPNNEDRANCGVRVHKVAGKKETLRVIFIPVGAEHSQREMTLPVNLVETLAEEYIRAHPDPADLTFRKVFSYGINQSVIKTMFNEIGPLLHRATWTGQVEPVEELLQKQDTNVNERAEFGWTALLVASAQGYPDLVRILMDAGANPDIGNVHGITPLMYGARYGNAEVTRVLLEYHAKVDLQDVYGCTALMVAVREGQEPIVEMLLDAGADPVIKDRQSMTALDFAYATKRGTIAKRLRGSNKASEATSKPAPGAGSSALQG